MGTGQARPGMAPLDDGADTPPDAELLVVGAHLSGQPLNGQLLALGGELVGSASTSDAYRLVALDTVPPKPGLVRHGPGRGAPIAGELWRMPLLGLGRLLAALPPPMSLTLVELSDGRYVVGFGCAHDAARYALDITEHGGWLAYLAAAPATPNPDRTS